MDLPNIQIKKILYATDLSDTAVHAFAYAVSLANLYGAGITILHVLTEYSEDKFISNMIDTDTWKEIKARHYADARDKLIGKKRGQGALKAALYAFSEQVRNGADNNTFETDEILIERGSPSEVIMNTARDHNCDLIVMGTHGHGVIADVLIGSTAKRVVKESRIPVLVVRIP